MNKVTEASYVGNLGFMEFAKFQRAATPEQKILFKELLAKKDFRAISELISNVLNVNLDDSFYKGVAR